MKRSHSRKECKGGEGTGWDKNIGQSIGWEGDLRVCTVEGKATGEGRQGPHPTSKEFGCCSMCYGSHCKILS